MTISRRIGFAAPPEKRPTGWKWDEMIWTKEQERHQSVIPTLMDPDISLIPEDLWRSGIGDGEDLRIINVVEDPHAGVPWYPVIKPGYYYLAWEQFYLFSPNSIIAFGGEETHSVWTNLTKVDLFWPPKPGEPIVVSFMHRREDGDVRDIDNFRHRVRFTGSTVIETDQYGDLVSKTEAIDLDSEGNVVDYNIANLPVNPEPRPLEFVVIQRPETFTKEWMPSNHVVGQGTGLLEVVTLGATPVYGPPVAFSNMNLFTDYVHDDTPVNPGEYSIGYAGSVNIPEGEVWVMTELDEDQIPGYVTYWTDFPATLLFNDYYVSRIGIEGWPPSAGTPPYELVTQGDYIGKSRMLPSQSFYLSYFPVLHPEEVRVFIYDPRNLQVEEWIRIEDLTIAGPDDKVFSISPDGGFVLFGDGVRGKIPHRYAHISAHYQYIPLVEYMPDESILAIVPETINLQPLNNSVHRGFIFLGHKEPIVDQLVLVTNRPRVPDRPDTYGPIDAGNDFALLTCTAFTNEGDVVPEQELTWTLVPPLGYINGTNPYYTPVRTVTDQSGRSRVTYTPVRTAVDMGVMVNLFEGDGSSTGNLTSTYQPNDTLILDEDVEGSIEDMWIFMVTNDDPMLPYDSARREGGRYVVLYRWDEDFYGAGPPPAGEWVPVRPSQLIGTKRILFDYSIPSPTDTPSLVQYAVLMDRIVNVNATTMNPVTGVQIISNDLKLFIRIPASQRGVFTLSGDTPDGSALDSAAYLSIARDGAMRFVFTGAPTSSTTSSTSSTTTTTGTGTTTSSTASTTSSTASTASTSSSTSTTATASTSSSTASTTSSTASTASTSSSTSTTASTSSSSSTSSTTSTTATAEIYCMFSEDFLPVSGEIQYTDLEIRGTDLYVASRGSIMKLDITNPALPVYTTKMNAPVASHNCMHFVGDYAYTADPHGYQRISIWNWNTMTYLGYHDTAPPFGFQFFNSRDPALVDSYAAGGYLYIADTGNGRLVILDISVPATPSFVTAYAPGADFAYIKSLKLDWPILYVGAYEPGVTGNVTALDVSNPLSISVVDQIYDTRFAHHDDMKLDLATNTLWVKSKEAVTLDEQLIAIDITNPASMSIVGNASWPYESGQAADVIDIVSNDTIFVAKLDTFRFDISDRTNPTDITPAGNWWKECIFGIGFDRSFSGILANGNTYIYGCEYNFGDSKISVFYISP